MPIDAIPKRHGFKAQKAGVMCHPLISQRHDRGSLLGTNLPYPCVEFPQLNSSYGLPWRRLGPPLHVRQRHPQQAVPPQIRQPRRHFQRSHRQEPIDEPLHPYLPG
jgi:hypothetical protein